MAANSGVDKQNNGFIRTQNVLRKLKQIRERYSQDYNWKVNIPTNTQFIVKCRAMPMTIYKYAVVCGISDRSKFLSLL